MRESLAQNRRALIFLGAGLGVLLLFLAFKLLSGGGGSPAPFSSPSVTTTTEPVAGSPGSAGPATTSANAGGAPVYTSKDPFTPLVNTNSGSSSGAGSSSSGSGPSSGTGSGASSGSGPGGTGSSSGSTTTTTNGGGASSAGAAPGGSTSPTAGQRFEVLDIFASGQSAAASVVVDGTQYQVTAQETFAGNYFVVDLSTSTQCGDFTHGGAPFHACKGQKVLK
jgi:hypothetical protein